MTVMPRSWREMPPWHPDRQTRHAGHPSPMGFRPRPTFVAATTQTSPPLPPSPETEEEAEEAEEVEEEAEEAIRPWQECGFEVPAGVWLNTLHKKVARHVRLPRSATRGVAGSQHPIFQIHNTPLELARHKCLEAGLVQEGEPVKRGKVTKTSFLGMGPMTAYNFCQVHSYKRLGQGSAVLQCPSRGRSTSDVMTIAIPPIRVVHCQSVDEWTLHVSLYLGVFNSSDHFTLPSKANDIYRGQEDPTSLFKRMSLKVLGEMCDADMPVSREFRRLLGPEYQSEDDLSSESEEEESEGSQASEPEN